LPLFGEGVVEGVELKFVGFEADLIEEGVQSLEVHLIDILLLDSFGQDGLIGKADGPAPLRRCELVVLNDVDVAVLSLHSERASRIEVLVLVLILVLLKLLERIGVPLRLFVLHNFLRSITEGHLVFSGRDAIIPEVHEAVAAEGRAGGPAVVGALVVEDLDVGYVVRLGLGRPLQRVLAPPLERKVRIDDRRSHRIDIVVNELVGGWRDAQHLRDLLGLVVAEEIVHPWVTLPSLVLVADEVLFKGEPDWHAGVLRVKVRVPQAGPNGRDCALF